jgi:hypothetical protein
MKIQLIRKEPITSLRIFFEEQNLNKWKYETVSFLSFENLLKMETMISMLELSLGSLYACLNCSDKIINSALLKTVVSNSRTLSERLIDGVISFLMEESDMDVKEIGQNLLTLISKEMPLSLSELFHISTYFDFVLQRIFVRMLQVLCE